MPTAHPNHAKMTAAVTRWIGEASARPNAVQLLRDRVLWFEKNLTRMGRDISVPAFEGLDAHDIGEAVATLERAIAELTRREAA